MTTSVLSVGRDDQELPIHVLDVGGFAVDISSSFWRLHDSTFPANVNWNRLEGCCEDAVRALKWQLIRLIETRSARHTCNTARYIGNFLCALRDNREDIENSVTLKSLIWYLEQLRKKRVEYQFHHIRAWYIASTDRLLQGFDDETAFALSDLRVGGNKKGFAVLSDDPDEGPLTEFEEAALRRALIRDTGAIQQRASLWLALAFGTNPANLSLLREDDFTVHEFDDDTPPAYFLNIPRIKKRTLPRAEFKVRYVDQPLAVIIQELLDFNRTFSGGRQGCRPLFRLKEPRPSLKDGPLADFAWHYSAGGITGLIADCVRRLGVVSPRTKMPLKVTTRRLRYTFACQMVRQGIAPRDLAELLDHTDTQNVQVYYNADSRFVERLDQAIAEQIGPSVRAFMGEIVKRGDQQIDLIPYRDLPELGQCGASFVCGLSAPKNCYTCTKFKAFSNGPHQAVLASLIDEREGLLKAGHERIAEQLDETILAVGEVVARTHGDAA
jgi:integrase